MLLVEAGGLGAGVAQPLVPLGADLYGGVVGGARVLDDAAPALGWFARESEFPVCVPVEIGAWGASVVVVRRGRWSGGTDRRGASFARGGAGLST